VLLCCLLASFVGFYDMNFGISYYTDISSNGYDIISLLYMDIEMAIHVAVVLNLYLLVGQVSTG
jgi:hypothetical protein